MNLTKLNPQQRQAVETTEGPLLIIAGPGSGKTHTLVERIVYLIQMHGVRPEEILVATFTEKAAAELITRVSNRLADLTISVNLNEMYIGTLHSICLRIIDDHRELTRLKRNYTVLDQFDQQYFLYQYKTLHEFQAIEGSELILGPRDSSGWRQADELVNWLNKATEEMLDPADLQASADERVRALGLLYAHYLAKLDTENALDFSTIQLEAYRLLEHNPSVLAKLRTRLRYLMIDEYQDTNTVQEALLLKLISERANVCVVGDDDQGLYRFRGATIRNILEFPRNFTNVVCARVELSENYRSHPDIVTFFNRWMDANDWTYGGTSFRYQKQIRPHAGAFWSGPAVVKAASTLGDDGWHEEVLAFLLHLRNEGRLNDWNQVAFLFRSVRNERVVALARFLEGHGIPVYSPRSNMFFERDEVRLLLGALIFLFPQFEQAIQANWPGTKEPDIWRYYEQCLQLFVDTVRHVEHRELLDWARRRALKHRTLSEPTDYAFSGLFYELLQFPMFSGYLGTDALGGVRDSRPARNLALLSKLLTKFEYFHHVNVLTADFIDRNLRYLFNNFLRFLRDGGLAEFEDTSEYAPSGCVSFMTVHQAKGLEFPVVIVGSLEAVPRKQHEELDEVLQARHYKKPPFEPLDRTKTYDFWRLYYTAFSRAQNLLVLTGAENLDGPGTKLPSRYFWPVYTVLPSWRSCADRLAAADFAATKEVELKPQYSFTSHITVYENCARQYKFFKFLDFAPVRQSTILFGTLVHQTIEDIHKAALRGETAHINPQQIEQWFRRNYHYLTTKERRYLAPRTLQSALDHVLRYVERNGKDWSHLQEAEVDVSLVKDTYILQGTVDLIEGDDDTVEIVDFKSEKKPDLHAERERVTRYRRQLEVYGHIVQERMKKKVTRLHLYYTGEKSGNPRVTFNMDEKSVQRTIGDFDRVVARIESGDFGLAERPVKLCENCDMRHYCDRL